jgi:hypothetical protein
MRNRLILLLIVVTLNLACEPTNTPAKATHSRAPAVSDETIALMASSAKELREERIYLVTLETRKKQFTLDIWAHIGNAMAAEERTIVVGEETYETYHVGDDVSEQFDSLGVLFDFEFSSYVVSVTDKTIEAEYFFTDKSHKTQTLDAFTYNRVLAFLQGQKANLNTVDYAGMTINYVLEKPLSTYIFKEFNPLKRFYVTVEVSNLTFTLDITKHLRNLANKHRITIEVTKDQYEQNATMWEPNINTGALFFKGRLSAMRGRIVDRSTQIDPDHQEAVTADCQRFIVNKWKK